eukprot:gb/GECH01009230.1/.p1 GENE.gb/GECH01009230.1/~~gb/GECH01009230.1/.p1  ORF type:complete len:210 (+),score=52.20 gb/GECH01009230.1/:1-630(+)
MEFISHVFNLFSDFFHQLFHVFSQQGKIVLLGLDNAGKTTLLDLLCHGRVAVHEPTIHPSNELFYLIMRTDKERVRISGITLDMIDLGGHESARTLWQDYYEGIDGVVFMVDGADREQLTSAKEVLHQVLNSSPEIENIPVLILGNKTDLYGSCTETQLLLELGIMGQTTGKEEKHSNQQKARPIELFMCSVVNKKGIIPGFKWLSKKF